MVATSAGARPPSILDKAFDLLSAFSGEQRVMSLAELARRTQLPKSTVHRLLAKLVSLDAIEHQPGGYALSLEFIRFGATAPAAQARDLAMPHLVALNRDTGCTVYFGVLRGVEVVCMEVLPSERSGEFLSPEKRRLPALNTPLGHALLAWSHPTLVEGIVAGTDGDLGSHALAERFSNIRRQGYVSGPLPDDDKFFGLAAPVLLETTAVAAFQVKIPLGVMSPNQVAREVTSISKDIADEFRTALADGRSRVAPPHLASKFALH